MKIWLFLFLAGLSQATGFKPEQEFKLRQKARQSLLEKNWDQALDALSLLEKSGVDSVSLAPFFFQALIQKNQIKAAWQACSQYPSPACSKEVQVFAQKNPDTAFYMDWLVQRKPLEKAVTLLRSGFMEADFLNDLARLLFERGDFDLAFELWNKAAYNTYALEASIRKKALEHRKNKAEKEFHDQKTALDLALYLRINPDEMSKWGVDLKLVEASLIEAQKRQTNWKLHLALAFLYLHSGLYQKFGIELTQATSEASDPLIREILQLVYIEEMQKIAPVTISLSARGSQPPSRLPSRPDQNR